MRIDDWKLYNHMLLPKCAPHEAADLLFLSSSEISSLMKNVRGGGNISSLDYGFRLWL